MKISEVVDSLHKTLGVPKASPEMRQLVLLFIKGYGQAMVDLGTFSENPKKATTRRRKTLSQLQEELITEFDNFFSKEVDIGP